jgi:hypothetical protein
MEREEADRPEAEVEQDDDDQERPERRQRREAEGGPQELHNLLRILARQRVVVRNEGPRATNADLIAALKESGMLSR